MAKIKLTKTAVESAQPQAKDVELRDTAAYDATTLERNGIGALTRIARCPDLLRGFFHGASLSF